MRSKILFLFIAIIFLGSGSAFAKKVELPELEKMVSMLKETDFIMQTTPELNSVMVNPAMWRTMTYPEKESSARMLAMFCEAKKHNLSSVEMGEGWVEIKDGYSGKRLAKYGTWGFKVD